MNMKRTTCTWLIIVGAVCALSACADDNDTPPTKDVLHVVTDEEESPQPFARPPQAPHALVAEASEPDSTPVSEAGAPVETSDAVTPQTECLPSGTRRR